MPEGAFPRRDPSGLRDPAAAQFRLQATAVPPSPSEEPVPAGIPARVPSRSTCGGPSSSPGTLSICGLPSSPFRERPGDKMAGGVTLRLSAMFSAFPACAPPRCPVPFHRDSGRESTSRCGPAAVFLSVAAIRCPTLDCAAVSRPPLGHHSFRAVHGATPSRRESHGAVIDAM